MTDGLRTGARGLGCVQEQLYQDTGYSGRERGPEAEEGEYDAVEPLLDAAEALFYAAYLAFEPPEAPGYVLRAGCGNHALIIGFASPASQGAPPLSPSSFPTYRRRGRPSPAPVDTGLRRYDGWPPTHRRRGRPPFVVPAEAGTHPRPPWIPACAGMTDGPLHTGEASASSFPYPESTDAERPWGWNKG